MKFNTKTIHAGLSADLSTGAIMTPIYQTSTYVQDSPGEHKGFEYSRTGNPTRLALEKNISALENGKHGLCYSSGLAAIDSVIKLLKAGDEVISTNDLYGGTYRLFTKVFANYGIKFHFCDATNYENVLNLVCEKTKLIWIETPTNPMLNIIDIEKITLAVKSKQILVCVDNTFATPYLQNPLDLGADIVMHSVTKFIGGHSDIIMGALICNNDDIAEQLFFLQNSCGAVPGPQDCFLALRGIKTLHVRMQRHSENGIEIANFLSKHNKIKNVFYPGLINHKNHDIAKKQMKNYGGMLSFDLNNSSLKKAEEFVSKTHFFTLAESLGGVESLCGHPASMTHAAIPKQERLKSGVTDSLIRLSVGIEDVDDLIYDLESTLKKV